MGAEFAIREVFEDSKIYALEVRIAHGDRRHCLRDLSRAVTVLACVSIAILAFFVLNFAVLALGALHHFLFRDFHVRKREPLSRSGDVEHFVYRSRRIIPLGDVLLTGDATDHVAVGGVRISASGPWLRDAGTKPIFRAKPIKNVFHHYTPSAFSMECRLKEKLV